MTWEPTRVYSFWLPAIDPWLEAGSMLTVFAMFSDASKTLVVVSESHGDLIPVKDRTS